MRPHRQQPIRLPCPWDSPGTGEGQYLVTEGLSPITTSNWILPKSKRSLEEDPRLQLRTTVWSTLDYSLMEPEQRFHLSCAWIPDPQNCEIIDVCFFKVLYVYPFVIHQKKKKKHKSSLTILTQICVFPLGVPIPFIHSSNLHILRLTTCYTLWYTMSAFMHAQLCMTLCDPMDYSPPGFSVHKIFQARILYWVAISFDKQWVDGGKWNILLTFLKPWVWERHKQTPCRCLIYKLWYLRNKEKTRFHKEKKFLNTGESEESSLRKLKLKLRPKRYM